MKTFDTNTKLRIYQMYADNISTVIISREFHTSPKKIKNVLLELGVDIHDPNKPIGKKVKPIGYWDVRENNEEAASKCRNRRDFSKKYSVAYKSAKTHGWILDYDKKYFTGGTKYISFDDPVHVIYAYEINETKSVYVGRTMDLRRRDLCHRNETQNDSLYKYCMANGLEVPEVKILEKNLTALESQEAENSWIDTYRSTGWNVINKASTGVGSSSLGSMPRKWNYDTCKEVAELCVSKEDFKKKFVGAYNVSRKNGWVNEFFPNNMKKQNGCFETLEACIEAAKPYKTIMEIRKCYPFLYQKISKHKWVEEVRKHLTGK